VDADVLAALADGHRARVIVELDEELDEAAAVDGEGWRPGRSDALQALEALSDGAFEIRARFRYSPAVAGRVTSDGLAELAAIPGVREVSLDPPLEAYLAQSTKFIGADSLHRRKGITGEGTVVAVLDTGVKSNQIDLRDAVVEEACFITPKELCPPEPHVADDVDGHGTAVSGIVASRGRQSYKGVAPDADIVAVKVLEERNNAAGSALVLALEWVLDRGNVDAINMSIGSGGYTDYCDDTNAYTRALAAVIDRLHRSGTVVVASSGNDGSSTKIAAPGCVRNAVSVGAVQDFAGGDPKLAQFTNRNATLDILAPGVGIVAPSIKGRPQPFGGTSAAAPHVAGAVALLRQVAPWAGADLIVNLLKEYGQRPNLRYGKTTVETLDVEAAYNALRKITPTATSEHPATATATATVAGPTRTPTISFPLTSTPTATQGAPTSGTPSTATDVVPTVSPGSTETPAGSETPGPPTATTAASATPEPTPASLAIFIPSAEKP
jgi:subtilisin family serine protease